MLPQTTPSHLHVSRRQQVQALSQPITSARTRSERRTAVRFAAHNFANLLAYKRKNVIFYPHVLTRPLEHIEVNLRMADNWKKTFAAIPLTDTHREPLNLYRDEMEGNPLAAIEDLLGLGYKVTVTWSEASTAFIVSVVGTSETKHNSDKVLSSFSDDLEECLFMAAFKVIRVAEGREWPTQAESARWG